MLKPLLLCLSTCLVFNFSVENIVIIFIFIILSFSLNGICYYNFIIDNLSCNLLLLTLFIIILCILTNRKLSQDKKYLLCNIFLLVFLLFSFLSKFLIFFFILFEASLIPLFLLIMGWGYQPERLQSSIYFLFYTLFGSLPLLVSLFLLKYTFILT